MPHYRSVCSQLLQGKKSSVGRGGFCKRVVEGPGVICGDFNVAKYISEKKNCTSRIKGMKELSDFIEEMKFVDLQLEDTTYT